VGDERTRPVGRQEEHRHREHEHAEEKEEFRTVSRVTNRRSYHLAIVAGAGASITRGHILAFPGGSGRGMRGSERMAGLVGRIARRNEEVGEGTVQRPLGDEEPPVQIEHTDDGS